MNVDYVRYINVYIYRPRFCDLFVPGTYALFLHLLGDSFKCLIKGSASKKSTPVCQSLTYCHLNLQCSLMWEHWHPWHAAHRNYSSGLKAGEGTVSHACSLQVWRGGRSKKKEQKFKDSCGKERNERPFVLTSHIVTFSICVYTSTHDIRKMFYQLVGCEMVSCLFTYYLCTIMILINILNYISCFTFVVLTFTFFIFVFI